MRRLTIPTLLLTTILLILWTLWPLALNISTNIPYAPGFAGVPGLDPDTTLPMTPTKYLWLGSWAMLAGSLAYYVRRPRPSIAHQFLLGCVLWVTLCPALALIFHAMGEWERISSVQLTYLVQHQTWNTPFWIGLPAVGLLATPFIRSAKCEPLILKSLAAANGLLLITALATFGHVAQQQGYFQTERRTVLLIMAYHGAYAAAIYAAIAGLWCAWAIVLTQPARETRGFAVQLP